MTVEIADHQNRLKRQLAAVELLEKEFLGFLWADVPATPDQLLERFERLFSELDLSEGLSPILVMQLFERLEQKSFYEIRKPTALAETTRPEDLGEHLPSRFIENAHAVRTHAYREMQSKQASAASKGPRPTRNHDKREAVERLLKKRIKSGEFDINDKRAPGKFAEEMCTVYEELNRPPTVVKWVKKILGHQAPSV